MSRTFFSHVFFWPVIMTKFVSKTYGGIELGTVNRYFYYDYTNPPKECPELFFPPTFFITAYFTNYICLENPAVTLAWFF